MAFYCGFLPTNILEIVWRYLGNLHFIALYNYNVLNNLMKISYYYLSNPLKCESFNPVAPSSFSPSRLLTQDQSCMLLRLTQHYRDYLTSVHKIQSHNCQSIYPPLTLFFLKWLPKMHSSQPYQILLSNTTKNLVFYTSQSTSPTSSNLLAQIISYWTFKFLLFLKDVS